MKKPTLRTYRRAIQISVAIAFIIIPWLNHMRISIVYGNFLSFHFFEFPLADPLAVLQITLKNHYLSADLLIGGGIALVIAAVLGTVFCSWLCPFGLLSELGHKWSKRWHPKKPSSTDRRHRWGFNIKMILFSLGLTGFFLFSTTPVLNQLSLPAWYSRIFQFWFEQWHISMAIVTLVSIVAIEMIAGKRLWCRYICPQSVLIIIAKQFNPKRLRIDFKPDTCICKGHHSDPCEQICSLDLNPKNLDVFPETQCTNCGDCVMACGKRGAALTFRLK